MLRVLIADDHPIVRKGLKGILQEEYPAVSIEEADDAESAIQKTSGSRFDLILSDLSMPGRSGLDVVYYIKEHFPKLPVLVLSIHPEEQYAIRSLKAGASGYLNKNAAPRKLIDGIETILKGEKYFPETVTEKIGGKMDADKTMLPHELLSARELKIFKMLTSGKKASEIASLLSLNIIDAYSLVAEVFSKMNMKTNFELTSYAMKNKLI